MPYSPVTDDANKLVRKVSRAAQVVGELTSFISVVDPRGCTAELLEYLTSVESALEAVAQFVRAEQTDVTRSASSSRDIPHGASVMAAMRSMDAASGTMHDVMEEWTARRVEWNAGIQSLREAERAAIPSTPPPRAPSPPAPSDILADPEGWLRSTVRRL